jgi:hypothetical protein
MIGDAEVYREYIEDNVVFADNINKIVETYNIDIEIVKKIYADILAISMPIIEIECE